MYTFSKKIIILRKGRSIQIVVVRYNIIQYRYLVFDQISILYSMQIQDKQSSGKSVSLDLPKMCLTLDGVKVVAVMLKSHYLQQVSNDVSGVVMSLICPTIRSLAVQNIRGCSVPSSVFCCMTAGYNDMILTSRRIVCEGTCLITCFLVLVVLYAVMLRCSVIISDLCTLVHVKAVGFILYF